MKKIIEYLAVCAILIATGCTDFGTETQLSLPGAPDVDISNIIAESDTTISFTVKPTGTAGFYSWMVAESETADASLKADRVLKLTAGGLVSGIANYAKTSDTIVHIIKLKPFTVYQIYAVASSPDGIVGNIKNSNIRTLDDGANPSPRTVNITDSTVTLTFQEPLQRGTGKVFVSYFAKNTLSGSKPLVIASGFESFNPQNIEVAEERLSVQGSALVIKLPAPPAGVYASITYEAGAVLDLEGNGSNAYINKADTLIAGAPSRGITVHVANRSWNLHSEFEDINPDTIFTFSEWDKLEIPALPDESITVSKKITTKTPTVIYKEERKVSTINVDTWGLLQGTPVFFLPEEPAFGAYVDLIIPEGSFEDVFGNVNNKLEIENNYLYSYGYTDNDIIGTYNISVESYWDGPLQETGITIEKDAVSSAFLIKNLFMDGTEIKAEFDPIMGTLTFEDEQFLMDDLLVGGNLYELYFTNANDYAPVIFKVPAPGKITSNADNMWGYYIENLGWWDVYISSEWTRTSTSVTSVPFAMKIEGGSAATTRTMKSSPFPSKKITKNK